MKQTPIEYGNGKEKGPVYFQDATPPALPKIKFAADSLAYPCCGAIHRSRRLAVTPTGRKHQQQQQWVQQYSTPVHKNSLPWR